MVDACGFRLAQRIKQEHPKLRRVPREQMRAAVKEEAFMLRFDQERALAALPHLLRTAEERREAVEIVRRIGYADGEITAESEALLDRIERILELDRSAPSKSQQRATRGSSTATAAE